MITQEYLQEWFFYDKDKGTLNWKKKRKRFKLGEPLKGSNNGYLMVCLEGKRYYVHTLIWLFHYNEYPECLDHIDRDTKNNRLDNLRKVTQQQNTLNRIKSKAVTTVREKNIYYCKQTKFYRCRVVRKPKELRANFRRLEDAVIWVRQAREQLHGEFACHDN